MTEREALTGFVRESNRIEGITRSPLPEELEAFAAFMGLDRVTVPDLCRYVVAIGGGELRELPGMNVRVGKHRPPDGGPEIVTRLQWILDRANENVDTPYWTHIHYETLHPFMDGNGRSGRALWAWQVVTFGHDPGSLAMGFLHPFYYSALENAR